MKERLEEWTVVFGHKIIKIEKTERFAIVIIESNFITMPELKTLGYMIDREIIGVELTKEYNRMSIWILNKE